MDGVLSEAKRRWDIADSAMSGVLESAVSDINFALLGKQWEPREMMDRRGRPCLVVNKLIYYVHQVMNNFRKSRPRIKIRGIDTQDDYKLAEVLNGVVRYIQNLSDSETALDTAMLHAITGGIGFVRVGTRYSDNYSFEQDIVIDRIDDVTKVRVPLHECSEFDMSDMRYAFITHTMSKEEFGERYPDKVPSDWDVVERDSKWCDTDTVTLVEYYRLVPTEFLLCKIVDQITGEEVIIELPYGADLSNYRVIDSRKITRNSVEWYLLSAWDVIDSGKIMCEYIPIVPFLGLEVKLFGKKEYISLVRYAKDPMRIRNYAKSQTAEHLALLPKQQFIAAEGQLDGHENEWALANIENRPFLVYRPVVKDGVLLPPPARAHPAQIPIGLVELIREADEDIKSCTGLFEASFGGISNEVSGRAILARQREGETANFHFFDNAAKSLRHVGRIIMSMLPHYYTTKRILKIMGEDMKESTVEVTEEISKLISGLSNSKYDIYVDTGASYATKRLETADMLMSFAQFNPQFATLVSDIIAKNLDWPGADELARRVRKLLPPELFTDDSNLDDKKLTEDEIRAIVADVKRLQEELQIKEEENKQLLAIINKLQSEVESRDKEISASLQKELLKQRGATERVRMAKQADLLQTIYKQEKQIPPYGDREELQQSQLTV